MRSEYRCTRMGTMCGHAPNPSSRIHAGETTVHLSRAACVACDSNLPRSPRSYHHFRSVRAANQVVQGYRVSTDDHLALHAMVGLANLAQFVSECTVLEVRRRVALAVVQASQHSLWGRLYLATSSSLRTHKWHCQLYTGCMDLLHRTWTSLIDSDRRLCILAFGCCLVPPSSSTSVMTFDWMASYVR